MLTQSQYERYNRQLILPQLGAEGQQKLLRAKVLVVGAGGLGCAMLPWLAAAGVGTIGICDDDVIQLHNLQRQVLYTTAQVGEKKAVCATAFIEALNPDITVETYTERLTNNNAIQLFEQYDIIADGTDNFATRYMINDACVLLKKPLVYASIAMFEGQLAVFDNTTENSCSYRDLFPTPPADDEIPNCAEAGVIGVLPAIIGSMQANEIIKLITGIGKPLHNQLLIYNALDCSSFKINITSNKSVSENLPADKIVFENFDYPAACGAGNDLEEITAADLLKITPVNYQIVDVRNAGELPEVEGGNVIQIPLPELAENTGALTAPVIITVCQSGKRSKQAAGILRSVFGNSKTIMSLKGGILEWLKNEADVR